MRLGRHLERGRYHNKGVATNGCVARARQALEGVLARAVVRGANDAATVWFILDELRAPHVGAFPQLQQMLYAKLSKFFIARARHNYRTTFLRR